MSRKPLTPEEVEFIERVQRAAAAGLHYEVLGIEVSSRREEIDRAYRDMVRTWHPDRYYSREQGAHAAAIQDNFVEITRAWRLLLDDAARAAYDRELEATGRMPAPRSATYATASTVTQADEPVSSFEVRMDRSGGKVRLESSSTVPLRPPEPPKPRAPAAIQRIHQQLASQFAKAREYFEVGKAEMAQGNWAQAESTLYLATRYDPKNPLYVATYKEAVAKARQLRAVQYVQLAEQAESYAKTREATDLLRKAVECDPADGTAFFRLGRLLREFEDDPRGALDMFRRAAQKDPKNLSWRLALGEMYETVGLRQNAAREARAIIEVDARNEKAKALLKRVSE